VTRDVRPLRTARLRLDALTVAHASLCFDLDSDPEVMRYITGGQPTPRDEIERMVSEERGNRWAACTIDGDTFIGWFALRKTLPREFELGYRLRRDAWGVGYATEGARALVEHAFHERGAQRVWAQTMTVNTRSRRVMEACGLHYVRTFHLDWDEPIEGTEFGDVEYELRRDVRRQVSRPR
jgi:RimJ/RimL family protein N-acetyltransferase